MRHFKRAILIAVLPTVHLCLCAYAAVSNDVWNWMLLGLIDIPLVLLQMYVVNRNSLGLASPLGLTIFGTMWWLCNGVALSFMIEWFKRRRRSKALNTDGE